MDEIDEALDFYEDSDSGSELEELEVISERSWNSFESSDEVSDLGEMLGDGGDGPNDVFTEELMDLEVTGQRGRRGSGRGVLFNWEDYPDEDPYEADWLPNFVERTGIVAEDLGDGKELDFFKLFFPDTVVDNIVRETNRYAAHVLLDSSTYRKERWTETYPEEIWAFIGIQICMGVYPQCSLPDHWSNSFIYSSLFGDVMSRNRYNYISSFLHFSDNANRIPRGQSGYNPFSKIQPLLDATTELYRSAYAPHTNISIDETMVAFKGRHHAKQYLPDKPHKWGFKVFSAVDPKNNYCYKYVFYAGKEHFSFLNPTAEGEGMGEKVVFALMENYFDKGHVIYTDSFYTSPTLFLKLQDRGTGAVGTVVENRKGYPAFLKKTNLKLKKFEPPKFARCNNLVACTWHDTKRVNLLSTIHTNNTVDKQVRSRHHQGGFRTTEKPVIAEVYNQHMGGVDHFNQRLVYNFYPYRCRKWYHPIFHFVKEVALVNGLILYQQHHDISQRMLRPKTFRLDLAKALVTPYAQNRLQRKQAARIPPTHINIDRLSSAAFNHFPQLRTDTSRPRCKVCTDAGESRVQTKFFCPACEVPLCPAPCFQLYHTKMDFARARVALGIKTPRKNS